MQYIGRGSKIHVSIILILLMFYCEIAHAEVKWMSKSMGLAGYKFTSLSIDKNNPNIIYAGSNGALLKTTDSGNTWKNIFKVPGAGKFINFIAINPKNSAVIYLATGSGIFKSENGGAKWSAASRNIREHDVLMLLIDIDDADIVFAITENSVYKSENGGANWVKSADGISDKNIRSIAQNFLDPEILFVSSEGGLSKSKNCGKTWEKIFFADPTNGEGQEKEYAEEAEFPGKPRSYITLDPINPSILYLATKRGIFKSEDGGKSWERLPKSGLTTSAVNNLISSPQKSGFLFLATEKGVFRFSEEENTWKEFNRGLSERKISFIALCNDRDVLWITAEDGVFESTGDIYEVNEKIALSGIDDLMQNFSHEPTFREVQKVAIEYAEVNPDKILKWRRAAKTKALLPTLSFGVEKDSSRGIHWDSGTNPDVWVTGPDDENTGWDITCSWDLGKLIWNDDQTSIDTRSKLMVELRNDIIDETTRLYFERRRIQLELLQNPPKDLNKKIDKELRVQELTANIDGMTGGYFSAEIEKRTNN
ncbi:MAG: YCF48-related protein [Candidatus Omnitrophica bacterium]|nr:YCF48-related protein [Candidatus Omnitrophota bacterium]